MFKCQSCNHSFGPKVQPLRVVVETREKEYPYREGANPRDGIDGTDDSGGRGSEIVREKVVCSKCASAFVDREAASVAVGPSTQLAGA